MRDLDLLESQEIRFPTHPDATRNKKIIIILPGELGIEISINPLKHNILESVKFP